MYVGGSAAGGGDSDQTGKEKAVSGKSGCWGKIAGYGLNCQEWQEGARGGHKAIAWGDRASRQGRKWSLREKQRKRELRY